MQASDAVWHMHMHAASTMNVLCSMLAAGTSAMAHRATPLLLVALLGLTAMSATAQIGNVAAGLSVDQCPMPTSSMFPSTVFPGSFNPFTAPAVQWCRLAERGQNSFVNNQATDGTRFWGAQRGPDVSAGAGNALPPQTTGGQCTPAASGLFPADGVGAASNYAPASKACQQVNNYMPNQCRVSLSHNAVPLCRLLSMHAFCDSKFHCLFLACCLPVCRHAHTKHVGAADTHKPLTRAPLVMRADRGPVGIQHQPVPHPWLQLPPVPLDLLHERRVRPARGDPGPGGPELP